MAKKTILTILLAFFLISLMIGSSLMMDEGEKTEKYKEITFKETSDGWIGYKENQKIVLQFPPSELEKIESNISNSFWTLSKHYITFLPEERLITPVNKAIDLVNNPVIACIEDQEGCENYPLKDCKDSTQTIGIIKITESEEQKITLQENCLTLQGDITYLSKTIDKLKLDKI